MTINKAVIAGFVARVFVSCAGALLAKWGVDSAQITGLANGVGEVVAVIAVYEISNLWVKAQAKSKVAKAIADAAEEGGGQ